MVKITELKEKEVVNIQNGCKLGYVSDIDINLEDGVVEALVIPGGSNFLGLFKRNNDIIIPWNFIRKIGVDVILVDISDNIT
ncbi:YlmC/YmxH family sporulation protein [Calorimonas adulescens]|uniref:YlmC/YmxH family sporulation protein n=1 Tax=Calorimonas adulescens TaxID=2606906 RepID=A0A5D8QBQ6_9THEO|nr:YlmC/YmxH family sporulation protein [Calorimonas adulescens]TZE81961.1 YlmC/YmxH family sporulation protein [Calorimonas adulescens]